MSRAALQLVGDWTSGRLLGRILGAIDSPWEPAPAGLTHRDTHETCIVRLHPPDTTLPEAFAAGDSATLPSLTKETRDAIATHRTVLSVQPAPALVGWDGARAALRCGADMVDAGAIAVLSAGTGRAHSADRWQALERMAQTAEQEGDRAMLAEVLYLAFVHPLRAAAGTWRSQGMALLEAPDVQVPSSVPQTAARDAIEGVCLRTLAGRAPVEDSRVRANPGSPTFRVQRGPDPLPPTVAAHNPYGLWRLTQ